MTPVSTKFSQEEVGFEPKNLPIPATVAALVAGFAFVAGLIAGPGTNSFIEGALNYSADSAGLVTNIGSFLPLGFAFAAGMVAAVNPCGFVMLPAFLTMYLTDQQGDAEDGRSTRCFSRSLLKALYVSAALGAGFVLLFGGVGLAISSGARSFISIFPWVGFFLGFVMAGLGAYLFAGGRLYNNRAQSAASRIGLASDTSVKGYFLFGISYAVASLSCTLPIFLGLISSSLATGGIAQATGQFLAYALGMTFVITVLTIGIAGFKGAIVNQIRRAMPYVHPISAGVLILVGGYLIFYWLTEGEVARNFGV
ncbi:MAG TPA: cytochrome c biogenesis protein CcdA [Dehalococcoidia bacterium]|jgi:cytochrome c biogenesis protein CcdA|nr:cytochrome C biogenesis protein [Chloroflexota bacterium]MDP6056753.1 cytochrome c biogenesis protein CcdA [Dehalococcoidia bacterium]MDP7089976.1 cytochrome c biogenesis protein CcdA [Dehalococcoidia bacterium]MDP7484762.1 cytochrome c biogenesis protein CcdA [Dehalococcoidia bacterium]HJP28320.1 cytochrome c biogenesis protein CcdA [Dehalococcoidia bacterium]|tara:strand:+ start:1603 stop:2532 length:930 start_codon:yes stop_codon:yes gene_type:complete